jgi:CRISPR-associated endonuclease Cas1
MADTTLPETLVISGYGIKVVVRDRHLVITGSGGQHHRIPRQPRTVRRLVILADSGYVTLEAQRWMSDAGIAWTHIEAGQVTSLAPVTMNSDARILRAQVCAGTTPAGLEISRLLLTAKLRGQADVIDKYLSAPDATRYIRKLADGIACGEFATFGGLEGQAADAYWATWCSRVAVPFNADDMLRVPAHWLAFTQRKSLTGTQPVNANACDPINATLSYLYRVAQTECVNACHAYGIHPAVGISHTDKSGRDSMALDLLEVIRPACDTIALDMLAPDGVIPYAGNRPAYFDRRWVTETREGTCRLTPPLAHRLASHAYELSTQVMPYAREVAAILARNADGVVTIPHVPGVVNLGRQVRKHNYPANRLRPGVTVSDVIPDDVWARIKPLLPVPDKPKRGPHYSASPREMAACLAIRYVLRCPWKDVPMASVVTVERWHKLWDADGTWDKAREVIESSGHLGSLTTA